MPTRDGIRTRVLADVDREHGVSIRLLPMTRAGGGRAEADASRGSFNAVGRIYVENLNPSLLIRNASKASGSSARATRVTINISRSLCPWAPGTDDLAVVDPDGEAVRYRVADPVTDDGAGGWLLILNRIS